MHAAEMITVELVETASLSDRVDALLTAGRTREALLAMTRAIEALQADSHPPQAIDPRVEQVLRAWGYCPLVPIDED